MVVGRAGQSLLKCLLLLGILNNFKHFINCSNKSLNKLLCVEGQESYMENLAKREDITWFCN
jgi:hypothetical protein